MTERFRTLDAMRGVAALAVIIMHSWPLTRDACASPTCNVPFGYLAVDMFFALSGFVISHSYDDRFRKGMKIRDFCLKRAVRLYPIFWLAALVGAIPFIWDLSQGIGGKLSFLIVLLFNGLLLPAPSFHHVDPFPLLSPAWSLFYELFVANLTFAIFWRWLTCPVLVTVILLALAALVISGMYYHSLDSGSLWATFPGGFARVIFSFYTGVWLQRIHHIGRAPKLPAVVLLAILAASFWPSLSFPKSLGYELFCVIILYPAIIFLGASAIERRPALGDELGNISYALYLIHIPILLILMRFKTAFYLPASFGLAASFIFLSITAAWAISKIYDLPARRLLSTRLQPISSSRSSSPPAPADRL